MAEVKVSKDLESKTLTIECVVNAPKEKVWRAYSDKEWFEKWWGPEGWDTTAKEHDFRPGGRIHYGMKCVDESQGEWFGQESWGIMEIESIDELNAFSAKDYFSDSEGVINTEMPTQRFEVELVDEGGKTRLVNPEYSGFGRAARAASQDGYGRGLLKPAQQAGRVAGRVAVSGFSAEQLERQVDFETFFAEAPSLNPSRRLITGVICGVRVEDIKEPTMQEIRYLDKLIDELAKGKPMEKILRA